MSPERVGVSPMLEKDKPKRILGVAVDRMQEASRFLPGAANVLQAEREDLVNAVRPGPDAAP